MRFVREFGTVEQIMPQGITTLRELPYPLFNAVRVGMLYLGFEELSREDQPPRRIWQDSDALKVWFDDVRSRNGSRSEPDSWERNIEDPVDNEAARSLIVG